MKKSLTKDLIKKPNYSNVGAIIILLVMFSLIIHYFISENKNKMDLLENGKYTIGIIGDSFGARHGSTIEYFYNVNGVRYRKTQSLKENVKHTNIKYFVKFSVQKPENSIILFDNPVGNDVLTAPLEGWAKLPNKK